MHSLIWGTVSSPVHAMFSFFYTIDHRTDGTEEKSVAQSIQPESLAKYCMFSGFSLVYYFTFTLYSRPIESESIQHLFFPQLVICD